MFDERDAPLEAKLMLQQSLRNPAILFLTDHNGDGKPDCLWMQTRGCLDAYAKSAKPSWAECQRAEIFHLAATTIQGKLLWEHGTSVPLDLPYISHFANGFVCTGGLDGSGDLLALRPMGGTHDLVAIDRRTGALKRDKHLPGNDWFWILKARTKHGEIISLDNGDMGYYPPRPSAHRFLFLDQDWNEVHLGSACGGGHWPITFDADGDGDEELLIGYDLFKADGRLLWRMQRWRNALLDPLEQHADQHLAVQAGDGRLLIVTAGSDALYLVEADGSLRWQRPGPHVQYCGVGRFSAGDPRSLIFVLNCRIEQDLYDLDGNLLWRGQLPENWPGGRPAALAANPQMHMGRPLSVWHDPLGTGLDLILYNEAGWPTAIDGSGAVRVEFPFPPEARQPDAFRVPGWPQFDDNPPHRPDDWGYGYNAEIADVDADGKEEVVIYDRRFCWIYRL